MSLLDTGQIVQPGQFKSTSAVHVFWLTRFKGCRITNTLQTPGRNFMGQMTTRKVWVLEPKGGRNTPAK